MKTGLEFAAWLWLPVFAYIVLRSRASWRTDQVDPVAALLGSAILSTFFSILAFCLYMAITTLIFRECV